MDSQLISTFQLFLLGTLIMTAYAGKYTSTEVYDIQSGAQFTHFNTYTNSPDYGYQTEVSKADCKGAGQYIGKNATTECAVKPSLHAVKHTSSSAEYFRMFLADCGGGVYVKVIGTNQFVVYYE